MDETKGIPPILNEGEPRKADVRAELKKHLDEEFSIALALQEGLTEGQRRSLHSLLTEDQISATVILQTLRSTEK